MEHASPASRRRTPPVRSPASAWTPGRSTTAGCGTAGCSASPSTTATNAATRSARPRVAELVGAEELYRRNGLQYLPFNTLYQLAADDRLAEADEILLVPDLVGCCAGRQPRHRAHQRLHHRPARRHHARVGHRADGPARPRRRALHRPGRRRPRDRATAPPCRRPRRRTHPRRRGRLSRHRLGGGRRTPADRRRGVRLPRHLGTRRASSSTSRCSPRRPGPPTSPTRAGWTAPSGSSRT